MTRTVTFTSPQWDFWEVYTACGSFIAFKKKGFQAYVQVGSRQIGPLQVGAAQVGMCQIAAAQISHLEIDVA